MAIDADNFCYVFLTNSSGGVNMNIDGSTPVAFTYTVPAGKKLELSRFNIAMVDGGMGYGEFGGLGATLTNGLSLTVINGSGLEILDFTDGKNLKANEDFCNLAGVDAIAQPVAGDDFFAVRFTVGKAGARMILKSGYQIQSVVADDLSNLTKFRIMIQGIYT